jgi:DNA polymerase I-like protein with 3'-5' exonuclease and polymerase domains
MKHTVDEERPHGLKETAVKYLGSWADRAQQDMIASIKQNGGRATKDNMEMWRASTELLGKYCAYDVVLTYMLYNLFQQKLEQESLLKLFYEDEIMPMYREVTIPMTDNGVPIDIKYFEDLKNRIDADIEDLKNL